MAAAIDCDFPEHPHPEFPCGVRVEAVTADKLGEFLRDCRPAADLTDQAIEAVVQTFRRNGIA